MPSRLLAVLQSVDVENLLERVGELGAGDSEVPRDGGLGQCPFCQDLGAFHVGLPVVDNGCQEADVEGLSPSDQRADVVEVGRIDEVGRSDATTP